MTYAVLAVVIVALLVERYLSARAHATETARLTNAVIAKTAGELHLLDSTPLAPPATVHRGEPSPLPDGFAGIAGLD